MKKLLIILLLLIPLTASALGISWYPGSIDFGQIKRREQYPFSYYIINSNPTANCFQSQQFEIIGYKEKPIPEQWITLDPDYFCLEPYTSQKINGILKIRPKFGIKPLKGDYRGWVGACLDVNGNLGLCAATTLKFKIWK